MPNYYAPVSENGSLVVNGQIVPVPMMGAFYPGIASVPFMRGSGQPPPTIPLNYMSAGYTMSDANAAAAASNPWSPSQSPLLWAIGALVVGLLGLRYIHWR